MEASIWTALEGLLVSVLEAIPAIYFAGSRREERRELMNIRRAGRKVVKNLHKGYGIYRIGFVNIYGEEDETELDAMNINDLERLWLSLCPEFECKGNSVCYVERVG